MICQGPLNFRQVRRAAAGFNKLVDGRAQKLRRLLQRVAHRVRNAGCDPLARLFNYTFHVCMVPLWHRLVNLVGARVTAASCVSVKQDFNFAFAGGARVSSPAALSPDTTHGNFPTARWTGHPLRLGQPRSVRAPAIYSNHPPRCRVPRAAGEAGRPVQGTVESLVAGGRTGVVPAGAGESVVAEMGGGRATGRLRRSRPQISGGVSVPAAVARKPD